MKKKLFFLISIFLLTGCDVNYNLVISEKKFNETITIIEDDSTKWNSNIVEDIDETYKNKIDWLENYPVYVFKKANVDPENEFNIIDGVKYYKKEKKITGNQYGINLITNGTIKEINDLRSLGYCYEFATVINNNDEYILSTSFKNNCFDTYQLLEEININITTDMKVTSNNADSVSGNKYTWKITRANYNNKSISLAMQSINDYDQEKNEIDDKENNKDNEIEKNNKNDYTMYIFCGILILLILLGYFIFQKIKKKNESFDIDD